MGLLFYYLLSSHPSSSFSHLLTVSRLRTRCPLAVVRDTLGCGISETGLSLLNCQHKALLM